MLEAQFKIVDPVIFSNTQYYIDNIKKHFIHYLKYKLTKCYYYKTIAGLHDIKSKLYIIYKTQI